MADDTPGRHGRNLGVVRDAKSFADGAKREVPREALKAPGMKGILGHRDGKV